MKHKNLTSKCISFLLAVVMVISLLPGWTVSAAAEEPETGPTVEVELESLSNLIAVTPGQLLPDTCEVAESDIYGYVVGYELKKGHVLSISDKSYVFSVRQLVAGNYSTMLKQATTASFTATKDMTVAMLIRKPDKSAVTAEELAEIVIYDTLYGMKDVNGVAHRFTVEAETIDGGTHTTRAAIFLPDSYTENGAPTRLIVMTNGHSAYLTNSVWNGNTANNVGVIRNYLNAGYAVYVVDNTAARTTQTPDLGCPQLVDSYLKAYEYIQEHFNVEEKFSIHSRSFGTFAAVRIMREVPELVKCAVMTGARVSIKKEWPGLDKAFIAKRFGFEDTTGATYEADKLVGYDPYTDVDGEEYTLPPTYWVLCKGDATERPLEVVEKLIAHGNNVKSITWTGTDHSGVCTLNTEEMFSDALTFLEGYQEVTPAEPVWEQGTIASANGQNNAASTRLRTADYLLLSDYGGVGINFGYTMTNFVYDAEYNYLGTSSWLGSGASFTTVQLQEKYPDGVYFRVALRTLDQVVLTVDDIPTTGVTFYAPGEEIPVPESEVKYEDVLKIGSWQDGTICDGKLFVFGGSGTGAVYDLATTVKLSSITLDNNDALKPHANSVCFGSTYYAEGDKYPLLYVNIYNNYASAADRMEGTCCVYRVTETGGTFATELVQVIRIGFTEDLTLWKSKENNGDVRPYGNFVVDTDAGRLYAFVMRDANKTTRFFRFALPALTEGVYNESYGCNVVTLESGDIEVQFDTEYFDYLQGCTYYDGKIVSAEGFSSGGSAEPVLRIIDLAEGKVTDTYYPAEAGLTKEPEVVCADPADGTLYYAAADGVLRILTLPDWHVHNYFSTVTASTCTEQGYTTYTCECGESYVGDYTDPIGHNYESGVCTRCGETEPIIPAGWMSVPISSEEESGHLAYKIEDGVLTFHDFGDSEAEDYGRLPNYTNTSVAETKYDITAWYQGRKQITSVVFDETISYIGSYTLTNMDLISEIHIEHPNAELARNMVLFSTTNRDAPLSIYAASTVSTVESWIRGSNNRKLSAAISDATMYYMDMEHLAAELKPFEDVLAADGKVDTAVLYRALLLVEDLPQNTYSISDYQCAIPGAEEILEILWSLSSGSCGENVTYQLSTMEEEGQLNLIISGTGAMEEYIDADQTPWSDVADCISDITIGDGVTDIPNGVLPKDATYHVYLNSEAYTYAKENEHTIQIDTLRVLCIGNSHTADYSEFRANILADLKKAGFETEITVARSIIGSIGLYSGRNSNVNATYRSHLEAICDQSGAYNSLKNNRYDLIVVQDYMESVVDAPEVFAAGLASFVRKVKSVAEENGNGVPQIAWFADWVDIRTTGGDNALYDGGGNKISLDVLTREQVYEKSLANIAWVEAAIAQGAADMPDFVIHGSTIKQNAMSSYLGSTKIWDKSAYCILERDTTHLTYELGRYLMGVGVVSEIVNHYSDVLMLGENGTDVGAVLTVENGPNAVGIGSQYEGSVNEELLAIIREAIGSPNEFRQSAYRTDPLDMVAEQLSAMIWDLEGAEDQDAALAAVTGQIATAIGEKVDRFTVELTDYASKNDFTINVFAGRGYSFREIAIAVHTCQYAAVTTPPTCTEQGYTTYTCACGESYAADYVDALGHRFGEVSALDKNTRQSVCAICSVSKTYERLSLPLYYSGEVYVENNSHGLYCGTRNVADLLGLKEGTYTSGDVTITIAGTAITVTGTPEKTLYFDLQKGTFGVPDYKRDPGYALPDGDYRFGLLGAGTTFPTACIRNPDGVGNAVACAGMRTYSNLSGENFGIPYLYLPAGKTYNFVGSLVLAMSMDASFDNDRAQTNKVSENGTFAVNNYLWSMDADIAVFGTVGSRDTGKIKYSDGAAEYINIYLPCEVGYLQIQLNLANNTSTNAYGWRLNMMYACDNNLNQIFPVTSPGEYEAAIQLAGRPDFMGMGAHGSEQMTSFAVYVDDIETTLDALSTMTDWKTIQIRRESNFYDPLDETTLVATHTVIYDFDLTGLTVSQDVNWLVDATCKTSYMMMFPVRRAYGKLQVSDTYFDDFDTTEYDVSESGFTTYPVKWTTGATKMTLYSEKSGITATMESLETMQLDGTGYKHCANSDSYNKLYFTICGGGGKEHVVVAGDRWHTKHRYEVTIDEGTDCFFGHDYSAGLCTVCGHDAVTVDVTDGNLTVTSDELGEGTILWLAAYDGSGKFLSMTKIIWSGTEQTLTLPEGTKFRLLFVDSTWTPLRTHLEF